MISINFLKKKKDYDILYLLWICSSMNNYTIMGSFPLNSHIFSSNISNTGWVNLFLLKIRSVEFWDSLLFFLVQDTFARLLNEKTNYLNNSILSQQWDQQSSILPQKPTLCITHLFNSLSNWQNQSPIWKRNNNICVKTVRWICFDCPNSIWDCREVWYCHFWDSLKIRLENAQEGRRKKKKKEKRKRNQSMPN